MDFEFRLSNILKLNTTFINRSNANEFVYELANNEADYPDGREIKTLFDYRTERRNIGFRRTNYSFGRPG